MMISIFVLCCTVLSYSYTGSLLSYIAVTIQPKPIDKLVELLDFSGHVASFTVTTGEWFELANDKVLTALQEKYETMPDIGKAYQEAGLGNIALLDSGVSLEYNIRKLFLNK